jgi:hypothetical protein
MVVAGQVKGGVRMKWCGLLTMLLFLTGMIAGCASKRKSYTLSDSEFRKMIKEYNQDAPQHEQLHCEKIRPTGSHFRHWVCRKMFVKNSEQFNAEQLMRRLSKVPAPSSD